MTMILSMRRRRRNQVGESNSRLYARTPMPPLNVAGGDAARRCVARVDAHRLASPATLSGGIGVRAYNREFDSPT